MTFSDAQIARLARLASAAVEGSGSGHTEYAHADSRGRGRYVVGGVVPARMFAVGTARPVIRAAVRRMMQAPMAPIARTVGYWEDNGTVYVDLGDTWHSLRAALSLARVRGELAIYDRETGGCIPVAPAFGALGGDSDTPGIHAA